MVEVQNHDRKTGEDLQNLNNRIDSALQVLAVLATKEETLTHGISSDCDGVCSKNGNEDNRNESLQKVKLVGERKGYKDGNKNQ